MTLAQFIHVAQFYETILCFSILVLIGQRLIMICRDLDQKYLKARAKQFDDQIDWEKSFTRQKEIIQQEQQEEKRIQEARRQAQEERKRLDQQKRQAQAPKQQNLKTSLVENQHDTTDRKMIQDQQTPVRNSVERKSLTDLRKSQERNSKVIVQIKDEDASKKSDSSEERRASSASESKQNNKFEQKNQNNEFRNKTINLEGAELKSVQMNNQEPSINPQFSEGEEDKLEKEYKDNQKIKYFIRIDAIFNEYLPVLMSILVIGILTHSTYIFTMVCFFGYIFTSLLFNYANLLSKLKQEPTETSIFSKANKLFAGLFIIALFISYWFDDQFG